MRTKRDIIAMKQQFPACQNYLVVILKNVDFWAPPSRGSDSVDQENIQEAVSAAVASQISNPK